MSKDFEISKLLGITDQNKYEAAVAAFEVIHHLDHIEYSRKEMTRKPAVKALMALSDERIKYDYIDDETRQQVEEELRNKARVQAQSALDAVFNAPGSAAPVAEDSEEDLEEIGEIAPVETVEEDGGDFEPMAADGDMDDGEPAADGDSDDDGDDDSED